jgi:hypothetical protein
MTNLRSALRCCLLAVLLTGLLVACGSSAPAGDSAATTAAAPTIAPTTPEPAESPAAEETVAPTEEIATTTEAALETTAVVADVTAEPAEATAEATEETVAATDPIDGFKLEETDQLSIQLPETWNVVDVSAENLEQVFEELKANNPEISDALGSPEALQGAVFWAFNGEPANSNFVDNLNIRSTPLGGQQISDMQEVLDVVLGEYEQLGLKVAETSTDLEINGQPAARVDYTFELNRPDGEAASIEGHQYLVLGNDALWILSYSIDPGSSSELFPLIEQSAKTFTTP